MTKPVGLVAREDLARKPRHGSPCNRCGVCCMVTKCVLGQHLFGQKLGRCPALEKTPDGFYECGIVADPAAYSIRTAIYGADKMREAASGSTRNSSANALTAIARTCRSATPRSRCGESPLPARPRP